MVSADRREDPSSRRSESNLGQSLVLVVVGVGELDEKLTGECGSIKGEFYGI